MAQVSKAMSNEIFGEYTTFVLQFNDRNISIKTAVDHVRLEGFPLPCLLCFLPGGGCITINLVTEIIPSHQYDQKAEFVIRQTCGGNCLLICS